MNMKERMLSIILVIITSALILNGCATTEKASKSLRQVDEPLKEVSIMEFILGPGDEIEITVYRQDDLKRTIRIDPSGMITYPLVGDIKAAGLSIFELRDKIRDGLSRYIINPQVSIAVTAVQSQKVIVLGEVNNPGLFSLEGPMTALEAMSRAGGFTVDAKQKSVLLIRGGLEKPQLVKLNLEDALNKGDLTQNVYLQNGDIVYVPATFIANVSRFFDHLSKIISPIVSMESGYFIGQQIERGGRVVVSPR
jgi:polysaccharide export outer membrane protein